jgi:hypothetical protein
MARRPPPERRGGGVERSGKLIDPRSVHCDLPSDAHDTFG